MEAVGIEIRLHRVGFARIRIVFNNACPDPYSVTFETSKGDCIFKLFSYRGTVTSEGIHIDLYMGGIHLTFPPNTVGEPTRIMVYRWKYGAPLPHLMEGEAVVGNVIEISAATKVGAFKFNSEVELVLSHSAAVLEGYELVLKRLTDTQNNEWEEIHRCEDIRKVSGNDFNSLNRQ